MLQIFKYIWLYFQILLFCCCGFFSVIGRHFLKPLELSVFYFIDSACGLGSQGGCTITYGLPILIGTLCFFTSLTPPVG